MKKFKKIIIIIVIVLLIIFIISCFIRKKAMTASNFSNLMKKNGYEIYDWTNNYKEVFSLKQSYIAVNKDKTYQIEFIEFNTKDEAIEIYNVNKNKMEDKKDSADKSMYLNKYSKNYSKYSAIADNSYMVLIRVKNTLLYIDVDKDYRKDVDKIIKKMRY